MPTSHIAAALCPPSAIDSGARNRKNDAPISTRPPANFTAVLGSLPRRAIASHAQAKTGANAMIMTGLTDWYQETGKAQPKTVFFAEASANRETVEPPWS